MQTERVGNTKPLESAENLELVFANRRGLEMNYNMMLILALLAKRDYFHMPPPTIREMGTYIQKSLSTDGSKPKEDFSTSVINDMLLELIEKKYVINWSKKGKIASRCITIRVEFGTIKLPNGDKSDINKFKDFDELTQPVSEISSS